MNKYSSFDWSIRASDILHKRLKFYKKMYSKSTINTHKPHEVLQQNINSEKNSNNPSNNPISEKQIEKLYFKTQEAQNFDICEKMAFIMKIRKKSIQKLKNEIIFSQEIISQSVSEKELFLLLGHNLHYFDKNFKKIDKFTTCEQFLDNLSKNVSENYDNCDIVLTSLSLEEEPMSFNIIKVQNMLCKIFMVIVEICKKMCNIQGQILKEFIESHEKIECMGNQDENLKEKKIQQNYISFDDEILLQQEIKLLEEKESDCERKIKKRNEQIICLAEILKENVEGIYDICVSVLEENPEIPVFNINWRCKMARYHWLLRIGIKDIDTVIGEDIMTCIRDLATIFPPEINLESIMNGCTKDLEGVPDYLLVLVIVALKDNIKRQIQNTKLEKNIHQEKNVQERLNESQENQNVFVINNKMRMVFEIQNETKHERNELNNLYRNPRFVKNQNPKIKLKATMEKIIKIKNQYVIDGLKKITKSKKHKKICDVTVRIEMLDRLKILKTVDWWKIFLEKSWKPIQLEEISELICSGYLKKIARMIKHIKAKHKEKNARRIIETQVNYLNDEK